MVGEMETVIEAQRKLLEERERVEEALVKEKMMKKTNVRSQTQYLAHVICLCVCVCVYVCVCVCVCVRVCVCVCVCAG